MQALSSVALGLSLTFHFPSSRRGLRYFVLSALDIGEYKRFDADVRRNLRKLSLLSCSCSRHFFYSLFCQKLF